LFFSRFSSFLIAICDTPLCTHREQLAATESRVAAQLTRQKAALDAVTKENDRLRHEENITHAEELNTAK
jgi:hypothetical protein